MQTRINYVFLYIFLKIKLTLSQLHVISLILKYHTTLLLSEQPDVETKASHQSPFSMLLFILFYF